MSFSFAVSRSWNCVNWKLHRCKRYPRLLVGLLHEDKHQTYFRLLLHHFCKRYFFIYKLQFYLIIYLQSLLRQPFLDWPFSLFWQVYNSGERKKIRRTLLNELYEIAVYKYQCYLENNFIYLFVKYVLSRREKTCDLLLIILTKLLTITVIPPKI